MKKCCLLLLMILSLAGCKAEETMETISDELAVPVIAQPGRISVELPGETALPAMENDNGRIYICNDYTITIQTLEGGDLEKTLQTMTGHKKEDMTVMETFHGGVDRYEFVWASAGEGGDLIGRGVILDDGNYHYSMAVLLEAEGTEKTQVNWDQVFSGFHLA